MTTWSAASCPVFWRELPPGPLAEDLAGFLGAAAELGFTERTRSATASQVVGRLLIQTGRRLDALTDNDFDDLLAASAAPTRPRETSRHYSSAVHTARQVMFHLGVLDRAAGERDQPAAAELHRSGCATPPRRCGRRSWPTSTG